MSWLIEWLIEKLNRVIYAKSEYFNIVSDGYIAHIFGKEVPLPQKRTDKEHVKNDDVANVMLDILQKERDGNYVQFVLSREYIKNILESNAEYISFSVNTEIDTSLYDDVKNAVIIRYDDIELMSILMTCQQNKLNLWTPDISNADSVS